MKKEEFFIPRMRFCVLSPVYWNAVLQTSPAVEEIYGRTLSYQYQIFENGQLNVIVSKRDWEETAEYISEKMINNSVYFANLEKKTESAKQKIFSFLEKIKNENLSALAGHELINYAEEIRELFLLYDAASLFAWYVAGDKLKQKIGNLLKLAGEELDIIAMPTEQTFATRMEREVLEAALQEHSVEKFAAKLAEKYFWLPFGYDGPAIWDSAHFAGRIEEHQKDIGLAKSKYDQMTQRENELKNRAEAIAGKKRFNSEEMRLLKILRAIATWTDERKMLEFQLYHRFHHILTELAGRKGLTVLDLKHLFVHELSGLESRAAELKTAAAQRMTAPFLVFFERGKACLASQSELQEIKKAIEEQSQKGEIHGHVACRGKKTKYTGVVRVLNSSRDCGNIMPGEILVASMTTPDFVPAMQKALGFITDEGGVTCHAAIVAREMDKPCIIGTQNATRILQDGDRVEMDMENGTVRTLLF